MPGEGDVLNEQQLIEIITRAQTAGLEAARRAILDMDRATDELARGQDAASRSATTAEQKVSALGRAQGMYAQMAQRAHMTSGQLTNVLGGVMGAAFVGVTNSAMRFQDQLATINTVAMTDAHTLAGWGEQIQALARETGKSTDDLTAGMYDLVSAGIPADQAINVLRDSAILATGALGSTGETVDLLTTALNSYGLAASESTRVSDLFAKAVADGKVTAAELGQSLAQIAPIAAAAGIKLEEVAAGYAMLTKNGVPAAQAATQMRSAISSLLTPNEELARIQKEVNINFAELARSDGLAAAMDMLRQAAGSDERFAKALGRLESYNFALLTTGDNAKDFADELRSMGDATGYAARQYDVAQSSAAAAGRRLHQQVQTFLQDMGQPFVETIGPAVMLVNQLGQAFGGLKNVALIAGGVVGAGATAIAQAVAAMWQKIPEDAGIKVAVASAGAAAGAIYAAASSAAETLILKMMYGWDAIKAASGLTGKIGTAVSLAGGAAGGVYGAAAAAAAQLAVAGLVLSIPASIVLISSQGDPDLTKPENLIGAYAGAGGIPVAIQPYLPKDEAEKRAVEMQRVLLSAWAASYPAEAAKMGLNEQIIQELADSGALAFQRSAKLSWNGFWSSLQSEMKKGRSMADIIKEWAAAGAITFDLSEVTFQPISQRIGQTWYESLRDGVRSRISQAASDPIVDAQVMAQVLYGDGARPDWGDIWGPNPQQRAATFLAWLDDEQTKRAAAQRFQEWGTNTLIPAAKDGLGQLLKSGGDLLGDLGGDLLGGLFADHGPNLFQEIAAGVRNTVQNLVTTTTNAANEAIANAPLEAARDLGEAIPSEIGQGLAQESRQVVDAMHNLQDILKHGLSPDQQVARALREKWGRVFREGLASEIPGAREAAFKMATEALAAMSRANAVKENSKWIGRRIAQLYADGFTESEVRAALAGEGLSEAAIDRLMDPKKRNRAKGHGRDLGEAHNQGVRSMKPDAGRAGGEVSEASERGMNPTRADLGSVATYARHLINSYLDIFGSDDTRRKAMEAGRGVVRATTRPMAMSRPRAEAPAELWALYRGEYSQHLVDAYLAPIEEGRLRASRAGYDLAAAVSGAMDGSGLSGMVGGQLGSMTVEGRRTVVIDAHLTHDVRSSDGSLERSGMTPGQVAAAMSQGGEASGFLRNVRQELGVLG